ncbi:hypothetical protein [Natrononativus amylolyticus]|uniref:hypothetical protein n=1 Tax=Natrononativus amylolyticus TaxID=2963434 RepID=UPI0020CBBDD0|nr:hypothetical protein [Natrononativus amylolyticus]
MFDQDAWKQGEQRTHRVESAESVQTIDDVELAEIRGRPVTKFAVAFAIGFLFFLVPVPWGEQITVPFDIVVSTITDSFPTLAGVYALLLILAGGILTTVAELRKRGVLDVSERTATRLTLPYWETAPAFWILRVAGAILATLVFLEVGPAWLYAPGTGGLVWGTLILSVAVIIPIGAVFVNLFVELGDLEFVGTMARPGSRRPVRHTDGYPRPRHRRHHAPRRRRRAAVAQMPSA